MTMIEESMVSCVIMQKARVPDGEGGFITAWVDGASFNASITFDSSMQARIADKQGVSSLYTVTTAKNARLDYHDVIKRVSDGKILRITSDSDDKQTPARAKFGQYLQVTAEEWTLPATVSQAQDSYTQGEAQESGEQDE